MPTQDLRAMAAAFFGVEKDTLPHPKYEFLEDITENVVGPLQPSFICAETLPTLAANLSFLPLQAIHLSRAWIHLLVTLANVITPEKDLTQEDLEDCFALTSLGFDLEDLFITIQEYSGDDAHAPCSKWQRRFDEIFIELCTQSRAEQVIRSMITFNTLQKIDYDILSARSRERAREKGKALNEEGPQDIRHEGSTVKPRDQASIRHSVASDTNKGTSPALSSKDREPELPQIYPPSFFWPLLDALDKAYQVTTPHDQAQSVQYSVVEQELPPAARARLGLTFGEYVAAAARAGIIVIGDSGDRAWIGLKEWKYPGKNVGSEGPLAHSHSIPHGESSSSGTGTSSGYGIDTSLGSGSATSKYVVIVNEQ